MKDTTSHFAKTPLASLPQDYIGKLLSASSVVISITFYLARAYMDDVTAGTVDMRFIEFCSLFCLIVMAGIVLLCANFIYAARPNGSLLPLMLFFGGVVCGWFLPVPPTAEQAFFTSNKARYEELVEMVRDGQLYRNDECSWGAFFAPPAGYESLLGTDDCIYVPQQQASKMVMIFEPRNPCRPIIYFQDPTMAGTRHNEPCYEGAYIFKQLTEHWYICEWDRCY